MPDTSSVPRRWKVGASAGMTVNAAAWSGGAMVLHEPFFAFAFAILSVLLGAMTVGMNDAIQNK